MKINFSRAALIVIDVQNDFCPGGALAVNNGQEVVEPLNRLIALFAARSGKVALTQDWHPEGHVSFASAHKNRKPGDTVDLPETGGQLLWPDHCVQGTEGADFHRGLDLKPANFIIRKGFRPGLDSYSAFFENDRKTPTGLEGLLKSLSVDTLVMGGLATDYCVLYSALDAAALGFKTIVAEDAVRGVGFPEGSVEAAFRRFREAGIIAAASGDIQ